MTRCIDCPAAGRCVVEWTGHTPYCEWAARGREWAAKVLELSEAGPDAAAITTEAYVGRPCCEGFDGYVTQEV
jgi:hypothetical protein